VISWLHLLLTWVCLLACRRSTSSPHTHHIFFIFDLQQPLYLSLTASWESVPPVYHHDLSPYRHVRVLSTHRDLGGAMIFSQFWSRCLPCSGLYHQVLLSSLFNTFVFRPYWRVADIESPVSFFFSCSSRRPPVCHIHNSRGLLVLISSVSLPSSFSVMHLYHRTVRTLRLHS
jgi:hypothetical protein